MSYNLFYQKESLDQIDDVFIGTLIIFFGLACQVPGALDTRFKSGMRRNQRKNLFQLKAFSCRTPERG